MTSNAGVREISRDSALGFQSERGMMRFEEIKSSAMAEVKRLFNPEFINRIDEIVVFHSLNRDHLQTILAIMIQEMRERLKEQRITVEFSKEVRAWLIEKGYDEKYGARPLRRILQKEVEDPLSMEILKGRFTSGSTVSVTLKDDQVVFKSRRSRRNGSGKQKELITR